MPDYENGSSDNPHFTGAKPCEPLANLTDDSSTIRAYEPSLKQEIWTSKNRDQRLTREIVCWLRAQGLELRDVIFAIIEGQ